MRPKHMNLAQMIQQSHQIKMVHKLAKNPKMGNLEISLTKKNAKDTFKGSLYGFKAEVLDEENLPSGEWAQVYDVPFLEAKADDVGVEFPMMVRLTRLGENRDGNQVLEIRPMEVVKKRRTPLKKKEPNLSLLCDRLKVLFSLKLNTIDIIKSRKTNIETRKLISIPDDSITDVYWYFCSSDNTLHLNQSIGNGLADETIRKFDLHEVGRWIFTPGMLGATKASFDMLERAIIHKTMQLTEELATEGLL